MIGEFSTGFVVLALLVVAASAVVLVQWFFLGKRYLKVTVPLLVVIVALWVVEDIRTTPEKIVRTVSAEEDDGDSEEDEAVVIEVEEKVGTEFMVADGDGILIGEDIELDMRTLGYGVDEIRSRFKEVVERDGIEVEVDVDAEVMEGKSRDMVLLTPENSAVEVTLYTTKVYGDAQRIMVSGDKGNEEVYRSVVRAVVEAASPGMENWEVKSVANRLLGVRTGRVVNTVKDGRVYSSARANNTGVMVFIEGQ